MTDKTREIVAASRAHFFSALILDRPTQTVRLYKDYDEQPEGAPLQVWQITREEMDSLLEQDVFDNIVG